MLLGAIILGTSYVGMFKNLVEHDFETSLANKTEIINVCDNGSSEHNVH